MDLSIPGSTTNSTLSTSLTPVFGDNVQDLLGRSALNVNPSAIITVNSLADAVDDLNSGVTTLRDAINQANGDTGEDLIVFDRSLFSNAQTIGLNSGELDLTHNLDIIAPRDPLTGADLVTVSGNQTSRVFKIGTGATVTLSGLIIANGQAQLDNGGGINNSGTLTLDSSIVSNNSATSTGKSFPLSGSGGGIYSSGTITVTNSTISGNSVLFGDGGGIYNDNGISTVNNSTISGNSAGDGVSVSRSGGGIYNDNGTSTVNNSTISDNSATFDGGGIYNDNGDTSTVNNSTISGNSAGDGGGIYNDRNSTMTVSNNTISGNSTKYYGGGIHNSGTMTVSNSTISGNSTYDGGGIYNSGNSTVSNSTISGNSATDSGGGIYNSYSGISMVSNSTISGNLSFTDDGGGICNDNGTSIISNSTISSNSAKFGGGIDNSGTSIVSNSTISGNSADNNGGGIYNNFNSMITVSNSTISGNSANKNGSSRQGEGGGIYNSGTVEVSYSTISGNSAIQNAGGIYNDRTLKVNNSTISGNSTNGAGGGIYNNYSGTLTLLFSTVTQNQAANGGGVYQVDVPRFIFGVPGSNSVRNTIIASNLNSENGVNPDVYGLFNSEGYNLIGDSTGSTGFGVTGDMVGTSDNPIDPRLASLDFNGGSTQTLALLPDSPAIGAGDPTVLDNDPTTDQRGLPRRASNGRSDIGAFEVQV